MFLFIRTSFLTEDGLFDMIRASKPAKAPKQDESKKSLNKAVAVPSPSKVPLRAETKAVAVPSPSKIHLKAETKGKPYRVFCSFTLLVLSFDFPC